MKTDKISLRLIVVLGLGILTNTFGADSPMDPLSVHPLPGKNALQGVHAHLCGFHFYSGDMQRSLRAEHYCSHPYPDVVQCLIYDSTASNARLVAVEYIISEALFLELPAEEKQLWHSHRYEVMAGLLTAPELTETAEHELMQELVSTYGKIWSLWQVDSGDKVPLGLPKLLMGYTADGQIDPRLLADRGKASGADPAVVRARRSDLVVRPVAPGADAWQQGQSFQINDALLKPIAR
jgi:Protein of unknown function (DUF1264)